VFASSPKPRLRIRAGRKIGIDLTVRPASRMGVPQFVRERWRGSIPTSLQVVPDLA